MTGFIADTPWVTYVPGGVQGLYAVTILDTSGNPINPAHPLSVTDAGLASINQHLGNIDSNIVNGSQQTLVRDIDGNFLDVVYNSANITTATTTVVSAAPCRFAALNVNTKGSGSTATIYDNTSGSGTKIATVDTASALGTIVYMRNCTVGLTVVTVGTADITVIFK